MSIPLLKEAMRQAIAANDALQTMLDVALPPSGRYENDAWTVYWVRDGEYSNEIEATLTPPEHCYELRTATLVNLIAVKEAVGADHICASIVAGELRYVVSWKRQP